MLQKHHYQSAIEKKHNLNIGKNLYQKENNSTIITRTKISSTFSKVKKFESIFQKPMHIYEFLSKILTK